MGVLLSKMKKTDGGGDPKRILMLGLDNAGKTTILYTLSLGETVTKTVPTIGFNVQTVTHKEISMSVWDVGGQSKIRGLWHHYLKGTHAVIYVVDSTDTERLQESSIEFHNLLKEPEVAKAAVLVMANKRDAPGCLSLEEIKEGLAWDTVQQTCELVETIATKNEGLSGALDWMTDRLSNRVKGESTDKQSFTRSKISNDRPKTGRDKLPVLTHKEMDREKEFKAAPLVQPHRSANSQNSLDPKSMSTTATTIGNSTSRWLTAEMSISSNPTMTLVLTVAEASEMLKKHPDDVVRLLTEGHIKGRKIAGEYRISTRTVIDYIENSYD